MTVELRDARRSATDREWLTNVYALYLHDLSEFDPSYYQLNARGRWEPDHLPSWLQDDRDHPLLIVASGQRVGCALVNQAPSPHMIAGTDFRMSEFFVLKRHRRTGVGRQAAFTLFDRFRGLWEIAELARNVPAVCFWRRVIGEYSAGRYQETVSPTEVRQLVDTRQCPARSSAD